MIKFWKSGEKRRAEVMEMIAETFDREASLERECAELRAKLNAPNDERLAQAYAIIDAMREEYERLDRKSFITMNDGQYEKLEEWKLNHWRNNENCQRMRLKYVRTFENGVMEVMCNICGASITIGEERKDRYPTVVSLRHSD